MAKKKKKAEKMLDELEHGLLKLKGELEIVRAILIGGLITPPPKSPESKPKAA